MNEKKKIQIAHQDKFEVMSKYTLSYLCLKKMKKKYCLKLVISIIPVNSWKKTPGKLLLI